MPADEYSFLFKYHKQYEAPVVNKHRLSHEAPINLAAQIAERTNGCRLYDLNLPRDRSEVSIQLVKFTPGWDGAVPKVERSKFSQLNVSGLSSLFGHPLVRACKKVDDDLAIIVIT